MSDKQQLVWLQGQVEMLECAIRQLHEQLDQAHRTANYYQDRNKVLCGQLAMAEFELLKAGNKLAYATERNEADGWVKS